MKEYFPMAVVMDNGRPIQLHTYDGTYSLQKARGQFKIWQNDYNYVLLTTWIQVVDNLIGKEFIMDHKCYINILGQVEKLE
jgi:hypothetical protein